MYTAIRALAKIAALTLIVWAGLFSLAAPAYAEDVTYEGSGFGDEIYFGYCTNCYQGGAGLRVCMSSGDDTLQHSRSLTAEKLIIHGMGGDDLIKAVSDATQRDCHFDNIANLTYSTIYLYGDDGNDTIYGGPGNDSLEGGAGSDTLRGGPGNDALHGGMGNDYLYGEGENDSIKGDEGNDFIYGGPGNDALHGGENDDYLYGEDDDDFIVGYWGVDLLAGGSGDDVLFGHSGADILMGGAGDDVLLGGLGQDMLNGGADYNAFVCRDDINATSYDSSIADTDCNDGTAGRTDIDVTSQLDPYVNWALAWVWGNGTAYSYDTTSSAALLQYEEDHLGAVILRGPDGDPLHTSHKQYNSVCGPASLNMVMEHLGLADRAKPMFMPSDLTKPAIPKDSATAGYVDVGYYLSMEHIMYEGYHSARAGNADWEEDKDFLLDTPTDNCCPRTTRVDSTPGYFEIDYPLSGGVQQWMRAGPAVGIPTFNYPAVAETGLAMIANKFARGRPDAAPVSLRVGSGTSFTDLAHLKAVIKGFIDNDIPVVVGVDDGDHFNTLMGYLESGPHFFVYTADPLDGREDDQGRPYTNKPMRWRKILLTLDALADKSGCLTSMLLYGHSEDGAWASRLDDLWDSDTLTGYLGSIPDYDPYYIEQKKAGDLQVPEGRRVDFPEDPLFGGIHRARDPGGATVYYRWDWDNDGNWDDIAPRAEHTWRNGPASVTVRVEALDGRVVADALSAGVVTIPIEIVNVAPTPEVGVAVGEVDPLRTGYKVTLPIYVVDPAGSRDQPYVITVDWGDGQSSTHTETMAVQAVYYYTPSAQKRDVVVKVTARDKDGAEGSTDTTVTVESEEYVAGQRAKANKIAQMQWIADILKLGKEMQWLLATPKPFVPIPEDIGLSESLIYHSLSELGIAYPLVDITPEGAFVRYDLPEGMSQSDAELYVMEMLAATGIASGELTIQTYQYFEPVRQATVQAKQVASFMNDEITYDELREQIVGISP